METIVGVIMIILGVVSIVLGFSPRWPQTRDAGAVFFVGGWLLIALDRIAWHLATIRSALSDRSAGEQAEPTPAESRGPSEAPEGDGES